jgi:undecaprenyl-diphosphatase
VNPSDPAPDEPCADADSRATDDLLGTVDRIDDLLGTVDRIDDLIDEWWERFRGNEVIDRVFYTASEAADFSILWHAIGVAKAMVRDDPRIAIELSVALGIESALVNGPVKSLFRRNRPVHDVPRPHALRQPRTSSFPSGHASAAMVAASLLSRRSRYRLLWYLLAFVVAASRAHVRIHHASDVVGGAAVGIGLGATARRLARRLRP